MSVATATHFRALHTGTAALLLPNAWDAASARIQARAGAKAIGTSSAAVCWSLGFRDGSTPPVDDLVAAVRRIARGLSVPLTVDIEGGYSEHLADVVQLVAALHCAGTVGINIEDGAQSGSVLAAKIDAIRSRFDASRLFINARTDVYLRSMASGPEAVSMVAARAALYKEAGADGLFVPGLSSVEETRQIASTTTLPLNLMALPGLAPVAELQLAGMRRLSAGPAQFLSAYAVVERDTKALLAGLTAPLFERALPFEETDSLCGALHLPA